jgi:hypothetical protein
MSKYYVTETRTINYVYLVEADNSEEAYEVFIDTTDYDDAYHVETIETYVNIEDTKEVDSIKRLTPSQESFNRGVKYALETLEEVYGESISETDIYAEYFKEAN